MARPSLNKEKSQHHWGAGGPAGGSDGTASRPHSIGSVGRFMSQGLPLVLCARCLLPAACPACHRLPEIQEPGDGRTKKNGCGSGSEEAAGRPASQQAFLQLSTPARHRDTGRWGTKESGGLRLTATQAHAWPPPKDAAGPRELKQKPTPRGSGQVAGHPHSLPRCSALLPREVPGRTWGLEREEGES